MIRILFIIVSCFYVLPNLNAQELCCTTIKKTYPNLTNKSIIANSPNIDRVEIEFEQKNPVWLSVFYKSDSLKTSVKYSNQYYDLKFEGDRYLFKKQHQKVNIPVLPNEEIDYMASMQQCKLNFRLNAAIYNDSIVYQFSQCCPSTEAEVFIFTKVDLTAKYKGDFKQVAKALELKYDEKVHRPVGDSVLIFSGLVNKDTLNDLENITLLEGVRSPFSEFIQQGLKESGKMWIPTIQGSRAVKSYVKIYARLNNDGSISMSTNK